MRNEDVEWLKAIVVRKLRIDRLSQVHDWQIISHPWEDAYLVRATLKPEPDWDVKTVRVTYRDWEAA